MSQIYEWLSYPHIEIQLCAMPKCKQKTCSNVIFFKDDVNVLNLKPFVVLLAIEVIVSLVKWWCCLPLECQMALKNCMIFCFFSLQDFYSCFMSFKWIHIWITYHLYLCKLLWLWLIKLYYSFIWLFFFWIKCQISTVERRKIRSITKLFPWMDHKKV